MSEKTEPTTIKLTDTQFAKFIENRNQTQQLGQAFQAAQARFNDIGALILDAHGLPADTDATVDEATKSLVIRPKPEAPKVEATPPAA